MGRLDQTEYTTVVAVDQRTVRQLRQVWPTWMQHRPHLREHPLTVIVDILERSFRDWKSDLAFIREDFPFAKHFLWEWPRGADEDLGLAPGEVISQRERMLTAWVRVAQAIDTPLFVKIDADVVATGPGLGYDQNLVDSRPVPAITGSSWSYTKPGIWVDRLQDWADAHPDLRCFPRLDLPSGADQKRFGHPRICSWICWLSTGWARYVSGLAPGRLPVPSQDTFHWYVAARRGDRIAKCPFKRLGWRTVSSDRARAELVAQVMEKAT